MSPLNITANQFSGCNEYMGSPGVSSTVSMGLKRGVLFPTVRPMVAVTFRFNADDATLILAVH